MFSISARLLRQTRTGSFFVSTSVPTESVMSVNDTIKCFVARRIPPLDDVVCGPLLVRSELALPPLFTGGAETPPQLRRGNLQKH